MTREIRMSQLRTDHMEDLCNKINQLAYNAGTFLGDEISAARFISLHSDEIEDYCMKEYGNIYGRTGPTEQQITELVFDAIELTGLYNAIMF